MCIVRAIDMRVRTDDNVRYMQLATYAQHRIAVRLACMCVCSVVYIHTYEMHVYVHVCCAVCV